jgi:DNA polymerase-4
VELTGVAFQIDFWTFELGSKCISCIREDKTQQLRSDAENGIIPFYILLASGFSRLTADQIPTAVMPRVIFHLDMDAFYASVEQRDNPDLRGKPVIVGSPPTQRGVVCAASYEARKFGVRSAMPSATAGRLCPKGIFLPPRMENYKAESAKIMDLLARTGATVEPMSIDEAYLDVSGVIAQPATGVIAFNEEGTQDDASEPDTDGALYAAVPLARELKRKILAERRLTATIGIATNKLLAKLASDFQKPDGLTLVPERDKVQFLRPLAVRALHGVGRATEDILHRAGVETVGDLQDYPGDLRALIGSFAVRLRAFAFGEDDRPLEVDDTIKSISSEETFLHDTEDRRILKKSLRDQAADVSGKLKRKRLAAHTVQVKLRYSDFRTLTRQLTVEGPITEAEELYRLACFLLAREKLVSRPLRLLGLGVSHLDLPVARQLELW